MKPSLEELAARIRDGERAALAQGITLIESSRPQDASRAATLLSLLPSRVAIRVGVSGIPGAGKSTFIDALGSRLCDEGLRVAVLAIDPSSQLSGGSILGDKTRMSQLLTREGAYVRPSPTRGSLGGVAERTSDAIALCEAAGFDVVLVETVGVGQNETVVAELVDVTLALFVAGGGDSLQGIKRGVLEVVDVLGIHKADGEGIERAKQTARSYHSALRLMRGKAIPVMTLSSVTGDGIDKLWATILHIRKERDLTALRTAQRVRAFERSVQAGLHALALGQLPELRAELLQAVREGALRPRVASQRWIEALLRRTNS